MPMSGKEMCKLYMSEGYTLVKGGGKGSHWKLRKGKRTAIIPNHKELKKGLEQALKKGLKN